MIVPFWSWNLSDTTHVRPHTKFQLVWAINTVFTRGGAQCAPPLTQMCSWDPLTIRVKQTRYLEMYLSTDNRVSKKCCRTGTKIFINDGWEKLT